MSHLTQMAGLAVHNFVSAAAGAAVAVALIRGLVRRRTHTLGNFWVDLVRTMHAHPAAARVRGRARARQPGRHPELPRRQDRSRRSTGQAQTIPGGPIASQEAIKEVGENGGGPFNANSSHPFENPNGITNILEIWMLLAIPFAFPCMFGKMAGRPEAGRGSSSPRCSCSGSRSRLIAMDVRGRRQPEAHRGRRQPGRHVDPVGRQHGGQGDPLRARGRRACSRRRRPAPRPARSTAQHDSLTPLGGAVPLVNMMLGEVEPGGTGSGLYGMLIFALLAVFIAGLMVGRTPEYLGKKIQAAEMKLVVLYILVVPLVILAFAGDLDRDAELALNSLAEHRVRTA